MKTKGNAHPLLVIAVLIFVFLVVIVVGKTIDTNRYDLSKQTVRDFFSSVIIRHTTSPTLPSESTPVSTPAYSQAKTAQLAQCLASQKFTMYGTQECSACKLEKSYFGESFALVSFVDCDQYKKLCQSKNIRVYPTWENNQGVQYLGAIPLPKLAELSHCPF